MHVIRFLKSDHSEPPGGRLNFLQKSVTRREDLHTCARRFLSNWWAKFNEAWYNNNIEVVVNVHCLIFKIRSYSAPWWEIELLAEYWIYQV